MKKTILSLFFGFIFSALSAQNTIDLSNIPIEDLNGNPFTLSQFDNNGKPFVLVFWAVWCTPCISLLDEWNESYDKWQEETGVKIIAISIDNQYTYKQVKPLVKDKDWSFDFYIDTERGFQTTIDFDNVPRYYLFDGQGQMSFQKIGYKANEDVLYPELLKISKSSQPR